VVKTFKLIVFNSLLVYSFITAHSLGAVAQSVLPSVCATRPDVIIRDFYTLDDRGRLDQGECMRTVNIQHSNPTIRAEYVTVKGGRSGKLRLISKKFVVYSY
jgi:hypothetical protein